MKYIFILFTAVLMLTGCRQTPVNGANFHFSIADGMCLDTVAEKTDILIYRDSIVFTKDNGMGFSLIFYIDGSPLFMKERGIHSDNQYEFIADREYCNTLFNEFARCLSFYPDSTDSFIIVSVTYQLMILCDRHGNINAMYPVSTSRYGIGNIENSNKTPLGAHAIKYMTGEGVPAGGIFRFRQYTGKIADIYSDMTDTEDDYVTTRIMHLEGMEEGINRGGNVDSYERHIYIHGTHEEGRIGIPSSHGCIRMHNNDVIELYEQAYASMPVIIIK